MKENQLFLQLLDPIRRLGRMEHMKIFRLKTMATDSKLVTLFIHSQFEFGDYLQDVEHAGKLCVPRTAAQQLK